MPSLEMLRKLLDEFAEKEAQTREEINIITQRIDELEERVVESQQKLVHLGIDKEKVLRMKEVYKGAVNTWTGPTNADGNNEASSAPASTPAYVSRPAAQAAAPSANPQVATPQAVVAPSAPPAPTPAPMPLQATTSQDSLRERLRPGRAGTNSMNNLEPVQAQPAPTNPVSPIPPSSLPSGPPVSVAALSPRNTGTKMPAMQPPELPPEVASPFTSEPAAVSSANPFNTPLFQAPSETVPASASSDPFAPMLEPNSAFGTSSQAEQSSAYSPPEAARTDAGGFPFPEQQLAAPAQPAYSGVNETNYAQQQPAVQPAQPALQAQDAGAENPFFRPVAGIRRETPLGPQPPLPVMPMDQPSPSPIQQAPENYPAQPAHSDPYDPFAAMQAAQQDPYSAMQAPQQDSYSTMQSAPQEPYSAQADPYGLQQQDPQAKAQQESQPPQISDFEEDEPDDTMKSINDALRGLFR